MTTTKSKTNKIVAGLLGLAMVLSLVGVNVAPAQALSIADIQAQIQALQAQLAAQSGSTTCSYTFTTNLKIGSRGEAVRQLQIVLNMSSDTQVAFSGAGSPGNESTYFGSKTKLAVKRFQEKYAASILSPVGLTRGTGLVGPSTRAKLNATCTTTPITPVTPGTGGTTTPATTTSGTLNVSAAANSSTAVSFPAGASQVPFTNVTFTAGNTDVTVTALNVYRGGISSDNDLSNVYLKDGNRVLASNIGLAQGKATFSQPNGLFIVKAGTSRVITIAADVSSTNTASHTYSFSINSSSDITSNATVMGAFPIMGSSMSAVSVSNPALATLTLNNVTTGTTVNAGTTGFLAGQLTLQAANSAVSVKSIKLTETGTINAATDVANIKLMQNGVQVGATATALNSDGTVVFDLSNNPLQIGSGQTVNLTIMADVVGGVNRTFQFTVQRSYDVVATDMTYNVGASVTAAAFPVSASSVSVNAGTLTISKNTSTVTTNYVASGATNQTLSSYNFTAYGEAVRVTGITYQIGWTGTPVQNTVFDNLKLVDDQGVQIGTLTNASATLTTNPAVVVVSNLNYIIPAGTTRVLSIKADVKGAGTAITSQITSGTAQGYTSLSSLTFGTFAGNALSLSTTPFSASLNNAVGAVNAVAGQTGVKVGSFALTAGPAEGVNVISLTLQTASTTAGLGTKFQNLRVQVGSTTIGTIQNSLSQTAQASYTFSVSSPLSIPVGGTIVADVYADPISGTTFTSAPVVNLTAVSATGAMTNTVEPAITPAVTGQNVTVNTSGTLTSSTSAVPVTSQYVAMGSTGVKIGSFKLSADNNEPLKVTQITLTDAVANGSTGNEFGNIRLMYGSTQIGTSVSSFGSIATGTATTTITVPIGTLVVPQNGNIQIDVIADVGTQSSGAVSGATDSINLAQVQYQGASGTTNTNSTVVGSGATFTAYRTTLNVSNGPTVTQPAGLSNSALVAQFNFAAGSANDAIIKSIDISNVGSLVTGSSSVPVKIYAANNPSVMLGSGTLTGTATSTITLNSTTGWDVGPGSTVALQVKSDLNSATGLTTTSPSTRSYQISLSNVKWYDGTTNNILLDPSIVTPVLGQSNSFTF